MLRLGRIAKLSTAIDCNATLSAANSITSTTSTRFNLKAIARVQPQSPSSTCLTYYGWQSRSHAATAASNHRPEPEQHQQQQQPIRQPEQQEDQLTPRIVADTATSRATISDGVSLRDEDAAQHAIGESTQTAIEKQDVAFAKSLPVVCSGCGALSQTVEAEAPGFYSPKRRHRRTTRPQNKHERQIYDSAVARLSDAEHIQLGTAGPGSVEQDSHDSADAAQPMLCERCHDLIYQHKGQPIIHPSMQSIREIIEASPHRENHIYHVIDAADFPMSLIPNLVASLDLPRLRTQNRRSKSRQYIRGRTADVSFIITRSDLLAPQKEQVDRMMPYLQQVLRDALGQTGKNVRLGNVRCVSSKRGWWAPQVKEEIWRRGGAGWVVGKANVGKSALFEVVYPKGRLNERASVNTASSAGPLPMVPLALADYETETQYEFDADEAAVVDEIDEASFLLPPPQGESQYPHMPIVSAVPGTTASPIRIPFGNGKGELIDLPGIQRSSLETHVLPKHRASLVMKSRIVPEQVTLTSDRSLLLGGIIRITPKTEGVTFLAYPFTPLRAHSSRTDKAMAIQTGVNDDGNQYEGAIENIGTDTAKQRIKSAGTFKLEWNVTKQRTGSLTDKAAGKRKVDDLPFVVYSADLLIEGVGWVELSCQVRSRKKSLITDALAAEYGGDVEANADLPEVEVFTPKGKFIGVRRPMNAWVIGGPKKVAKHAQKKRPRMTISFQRRREGGGAALSKVD